MKEALLESARRAVAIKEGITAIVLAVGGFGTLGVGVVGLYGALRDKPVVETTWAKFRADPPTSGRVRIADAPLVDARTVRIKGEDGKRKAVSSYVPIVADPADPAGPALAFAMDRDAPRDEPPPPAGPPAALVEPVQGDVEPLDPAVAAILAERCAPVGPGAVALRLPDEAAPLKAGLMILLGVIMLFAMRSKLRKAREFARTAAPEA